MGQRNHLWIHVYVIHHMVIFPIFFQTQTLLHRRPLQPAPHGALQYVLHSIHTSTAYPSVCQTLRIISFLSTSLPSPNYHCREGEPTAIREPAQHWWDHIIVDVKRQSTHGCGDLIFSSHTTFALVGTLTYTEYGTIRAIKLLLWCCMLTLSCLIIASRKHYTVDVVVAYYTVPLVFYAALRRWTTKRPKDEWMHRPDAAAEPLQEVVLVPMEVRVLVFVLERMVCLYMLTKTALAGSAAAGGQGRAGTCKGPHDAHPCSIRWAGGRCCRDHAVRVMQTTRCRVSLCSRRLAAEVAPDREAFQVATNVGCVVS